MNKKIEIVPKQEHPVDALKQWLTFAGLAYQINSERERALRAMCDEPVDAR